MEVNYMMSLTWGHTHSYIQSSWLLVTSCDVNMALAVTVNYQIESNVNSRDTFQRMDMEILINLLWVLSNSAVVSAVSCTCMFAYFQETRIGHDKEIVLITADHYDEILFSFSSLCHIQKSASSGLLGCGGLSRHFWNKYFQQIMRVLHILCVEYMVTNSTCNTRRPIISEYVKSCWVVFQQDYLLTV